MSINFKEIITLVVLTMIMMLAGRFGGIIGAGIVTTALMVYYHKERKYIHFFFIIIITFILGDNYNNILGIFNMLRFVVLGVATVIFINYFHHKNNVSPYILPFAIFAFIVSLASSPVKSQSVPRALAFFVMTIVFLDIFRYYYVSAPNKVNKLLVNVAFIYFGAGIVLLASPFRSLAIQDIRYTGLMNNPNGVGLVSILMYAILDLIAKKNPQSNRTIFTLLKILIFISVILSGSRNGLGSIIIYELAKRFFSSIIGKIVFFFVFAFFIVVSIELNISDIIHTLNLQDYMRIETLETASGRTEVWEVVWQEIKKNPWIGKGILYDNYFIAQYVEQYFMGIAPGREWSGVWNSYLSMLMNVGIVGLILFFAFFIPLFKRSHDKNLARAFLFAALISAVVESWFAASMNAYFPLFLIYFAIQIGDRDIALAKQRTLANNN